MTDVLKLTFDTLVVFTGTVGIEIELESKLEIGGNSVVLCTDGGRIDVDPFPAVIVVTLYTVDVTLAFTAFDCVLTLNISYVVVEDDGMPMLVDRLETLPA